MKLPFDRETNQYEKSIAEASDILGDNDEDVISIKIRPIDRIRIEKEGDIVNAYVYPEEYKSIYSYLSKYNETGQGRVNSGKAIKIKYDGGEIVFVEHETGPEIIAYLGLITASLTLANSMVELIKEIIRTVNIANEKKKKDDKDSGRYYKAEAIVIETRTKKGKRIFKNIPLPLADNKFIDEKELKEILKGKKKQKK